MAIAALNFPEHKTAVIAMVLLHMIIGGIVAIPYTVWSKRSHAAISVAAKP